MTLLLKTFSLKSFAKFALTAAVMSVSYLRRDNRDSLMQSLLTGLTSTSSSNGLTEQAKKYLSNVTKNLFTEVSGIRGDTMPASSPVTLSVSLLEKLALCLSHCDPGEVSHWCSISSSSPVS